MLQDWTFKQPAGAVKAQVLMGSTLLRKYRNGSVSDRYPVPTMMLSGTLDGLFRVTRQAESYYHYVTNHIDPPTDYPVVIVEGVSHWSFGSNAPPSLVKSHDLKPEVEERCLKPLACQPANNVNQQLKFKQGPFTSLQH